MPLGGSPDLPYRVRFNLRGNDSAVIISNLVLVGILAAAWIRVARCTYLVIDAAICFADILWRRACRSAPGGGSYGRWRHLLGLLLCLNEAVLGAPTVLARSWLDRVGWEGPAGWECTPALAVRHAVMVLLVSQATTLALMWEIRPMTLCWALPAQLFRTLALARVNSTVCSCSALSSPAALRQLHHAYLVFGAWRFTLLPTIPAPPPAECATLLAYLQLTIGFALPALAQAAGEVRRFTQHQRQRQQCGLPPERGAHAWLFECLARLLEVPNSLTCVAALWILLGTLFDTSLLLSGVPAAPLAY